MDEAPKNLSNPVILGQMARVEPCGCGGSLLLTVGAVSLRLDRAAAADVAATLEHALRLLGPDAATAGLSAGDN